MELDDGELFFAMMSGFRDNRARIWTTAVNVR